MILTKGEIERLKAHPINQTELDYIDTIEQLWREGDETLKALNRLNAGWEAANATILDRDFEIIGLVDEFARCAAELEELKQCVRDEAIMDRW